MAENIVFKPRPLVLRLRMTEARTDLVRERLMSMVKLRLQEIRAANGYLTEFGATVHRGMLIVAEPDPIPCINFWDTDQSSSKGYGVQDNTLSVIVATYDKLASDGDENPDELVTPAVKVLADVERAMQYNHVTKQYDPFFDGMVQRLGYDSSEHVSGLQPELWIQTASRFTFVYQTRLGDPFQQVAAA